MSVANLMASPLAKGLFKRAIVDRAGMATWSDRSPSHGVSWRELAKMLRVEPKRSKAFRSNARSSARAGRAEAKMSQAGREWARTCKNPDGREPAFGLSSRFLPVYGDDVLPERPIVALQKGASADVELLVGANSRRNEPLFRAAAAFSVITLASSSPISSRVRPPSREAKEILKAYGIDDRRQTPRRSAFTEDADGSGVSSPRAPLCAQSTSRAALARVRIRLALDRV